MRVLGNLANRTGSVGDRLAALDGVVAVVQADAEDLAGVGDRRQELDGVGRVLHRAVGRGGVGGGLADGRGGGEQEADGGRQPRVGGVQVDEGVADLGGGAGAVGGEDGGEPHGNSAV